MSGSKKEKINSLYRLFKVFKKFWPILVIFLLVTIFAYPYWAKNRIPFPADYLVTAFPPWQYYYGMPVKNTAMPDVVGQMYPYRHLVIENWKNFQIPLWNPYNFSGNPFLANYQSAVFHPLNFLFFILPEIDAWSLMILLQPLLAGLFTYLFCRQLNLSRAASLISAIAFMFCGFITTWMAYGTMAYALLWLPLILYGIEKSFHKISVIPLLIVCLGLMASFFSGHFQVSLYVAIASFAYLLFKLITSRNWTVFLIILFFFCLGVCLTSIQLFPTIELYKLSVRSQVKGFSEIIPWQYLITIFAPDFYGNPVTRNNWFGDYAEWSSYIGVIPLILSLLVVFRRKKPVVYYFLILGMASLILRHQTFLLDIILKLKIPVLSSSSVARINCLLSFSLAVMAGFGFEEVINDLKNNKMKRLVIFSLTFLILILGIWGFLLFKKPFEPLGIQVAKRNLILPTAMAAAFGGLIFFAWIINKLLFQKKIILRFVTVYIFLVIFLTAFDCWRFAYKWMPFDSKEQVYPNLSILKYLNQTIGNDRLFGFVGMEMMNYFKIQGFNGYDPLFIQRYAEFLESAKYGKIQVSSIRGVDLQRRAQYTNRIASLLGGKYFLHAIPDDQKCWEFNFWDYPEQFKFIYKDEKYEVYENKGALPRAYMVNDYQVIVEPQKIVDYLLDSENDLRKMIVLEQEPEEKLAIADKNQVEKTSVAINRYQSNRVDISIMSPNDGFLFLSDNYYPGWRALVDGQEKKIYRANYSFRAVFIPQGKHEVKFIYKPQSFNNGLKASFFSLVVVIISSFLIKKWSQRK